MNPAQIRIPGTEPRKYHWQFEGRTPPELIVQGWPKSQERVRKVRYHVADTCTATDIRSARKIFRKLYDRGLDYSAF